MRSNPSSAEWGFMSAERTQSPTHAVAALAARQHGAIDRAGLRACGLSDTAITRQVAHGRLHPKWPGVFAVGHPHLTREGWWWAALLAGGPGSVLAGRAAAAAWRLLPGLSLTDLVVTSDRARKLPGLRARRCALHPDDVTEYRGLRITTIARTALDLGAWDKPERVGEALDSTLLEGWYDHGEMLALVARHAGHRGMGVLRSQLTVLGDHPPRFRSRAERRARDHISDASLLVPEVNFWLPTTAGHGYELDLFWPSLAVNVEIDGPRHELPFQRAKDRRRDAELRARGICVVRHPTTLVDDHPERFVLAIRDLLHEWGFMSAQRT